VTKILNTVHILTHSQVGMGYPYKYQEHLFTVQGQCLGHSHSHWLWEVSLTCVYLMVGTRPSACICSFCHQLCASCSHLHWSLHENRRAVYENSIISLDHTFPIISTAPQLSDHVSKFKICSYYLTVLDTMRYLVPTACTDGVCQVYLPIFLFSCKTKSRKWSLWS